ncbi:MAG: quaternary ammonium compound efflux SMR transporter SugE [Stygiobacter sp.]|jgi:quaternary ammonium compound-resistance protein SugE|uniref:Guanidinium exporter n=1 Tax=Stygiobacter electus TaxID=3032292 RepID=A0AAE3TD30_9BACT|nr:quaternary ammonium compound efflux SMR transporter SugE [Stygiobacter electus]MDF1613003.1 quaternary ammonium compound efflux SMR transporter SugE [Stygiobacter electus]
MAWIYIFIASIFEISWAVGLKYSNGFTNFYPSLFTIITMILSYVFLSFGAKTLPIGTAYAVWTGIGAVGTAIYGILFFNEPKDFLRVLFIFLIVVGIIGLRLTYKEN